MLPQQHPLHRSNKQPHDTISSYSAVHSSPSYIAVSGAVSRSLILCHLITLSYASMMLPHIRTIPPLSPQQSQPAAIPCIATAP